MLVVDHEDGKTLQTTDALTSQRDANAVTTNGHPPPYKRLKLNHPHQPQIRLQTPLQTMQAHAGHALGGAGSRLGVPVKVEALGTNPDKNDQLGQLNDQTVMEGMRRFYEQAMERDHQVDDASIATSLNTAPTPSSPSSSSPSSTSLSSSYPSFPPSSLSSSSSSSSLLPSFSSSCPAVPPSSMLPSTSHEAVAVNSFQTSQDNSSSTRVDGDAGDAKSNGSVVAESISRTMTVADGRAAGGADNSDSHTARSNEPASPALPSSALPTSTPRSPTGKTAFMGSSGEAKGETKMPSDPTLLAILEAGLDPSEIERDADMQITYNIDGSIRRKRGRKPTHDDPHEVCLM